MSDLSDFIPKNLFVGQTFDAPTGLDFGSQYAEIPHGRDLSLPAASYPELAAVFDRTQTSKYTDEVEIANPSPIASSERYGWGTSCDDKCERIVVTSGIADMFVHKRTGTSWALEQTITTPHSSSGNYGSVVMNKAGDMIVVGANTNDVAYVYTRSGTTWTLVQTLTSFATVGNGQLGGSVDISADGQYLVVGDYQRNDPTNTQINHGAIQIYRWKSATNSWAYTQTITNPVTVLHGDYYGYRVALDGNGRNLIVGAPLSSGDAEYGSGANAGKVYHYKRYGDFWYLAQVINTQYGLDPFSSALFGVNVAISGDGSIVAVGETGAAVEHPDITDTDYWQGCVRIFKLSENDHNVQMYSHSFTEDLDIFAPNPQTNVGEFGSMLELSTDGRTLVVGDVRDSGLGYGACHVYKFKAKDYSTIEHVYSFYSPGPNSLEFTGISGAVSTDGSRVVYGRYAKHGTFADEGTVKIITTENQTANIYIPRKYYTDQIRTYMRVK